MKAIKTIRNILMILLLCSTITESQNISNRTRGYWTLGINGGWAYQSSDVSSEFNGYGLGLTLAKNLYYRPNHLLNFDLRGRFLYANMYGLDDEKHTGISNNTALNGTKSLDYSNLGYVYQNYNTKLGELSLEGVIAFNKMREKHNWELSLYGGLGLDLYQTKIDQFNNRNQTTYEDDYKNLEGSSGIKSTLKNDILDQDYETLADGQDNLSANFMPSLGFDLNYWFTPRFALGIGHRVTFSQTDDIDGSQWESNNSLSGNEDLYHYTNIGMRWILGGKKKEKLPEITYTDPYENPYHSNQRKVDIKATVKNVNHPNNVRCYFNDREVRFDYFGGNLSTYVKLQPGRNEFVTTATNTAGSVSETQVIYYKTKEKEHVPTHHTPPKHDYDEPEIVEVIDAPEIRFRNPSRDYQKTKRSNFDLKISVKNVTNKRDINLYINNRNISNFNFRNNTITKSIVLSEGTTSIRVAAENDGGTAEKVRRIILEKQIIQGNPHTDTDTNTPPADRSRPTVEITSPSSSPYDTYKTSYVIKADIENIRNKNDITFTFNGQRQTRFSYDSQHQEFSGKVILRTGKNTIIVQAKNNYGQADDLVEITFKKLNKPNITKPIVKIISTSSPTATTDKCKSSIVAEIKNIVSKNDIQFTVNGKRITQFDFSNKTKIFKANNIDLKSGKNTLIITATNKGGKGQDQTSITCTLKQGKKPEITIYSPKNNSNSKSSSTKLDAKVKNVDHFSNITVSVNNQPISKFEFNANTGKLKVTTRLINGKNTIKIFAKNKFGNATKTVHINYKKVDIPNIPKLPTVTILNPKNGKQTSIPTTDVKAKVQNATKHQIKFTINGKIERFTLQRNILTAKVPLKKGKNNIVISIKNRDGNAIDKVSITYKPKVVLSKPIITDVKPNERTRKLNTKMNLSAEIQNIKSERDLVVKINGKTMHGITYSSRSKLMQLPIVLSKGKTKIEIIATNKAGVSTKIVNLTMKGVIDLGEGGLTRKPTIEFNSVSQPTSSPFNPEAFKSALSAFVKGVGSKSDITIKVNGKELKDFKYITKSNKIIATIDVKRGKNTIDITARNKFGTVSRSHSFDF